MKLFMLLLAVSSGAFASEIKLTADVQEELEMNVYSAYRGGKKDFNAEKMGRRVQKSLNTLIKFGSHHLMRRGHKEGKVILETWEKKYFTVFLNAEIGVTDIGDHEAIEFLLKSYNTMLSFLGEKMMASSHLDDIRVLAYAIPVVFKPARDDVNQVDYKQHFVPFSKAIGYWLILGGCTIYNWIGTPVTTLICDPVSEAGRLAFGLLGDPLSDMIWNGAHGRETYSSFES